MSTQSIDPRNGVPFGPEFADSDDGQVRLACAEAASAFPRWSGLSAAARADVLTTMADKLDAATDQLVALADAETALGKVRLAGEVSRTTFQLRMLADDIRGGTYTDPIVDTEVSGAPPIGHPEIRRLLLPIGPVAIYAASNFPFAFSVAGGDTASALAAGCTVVIKAHPGHPQTSEAVHAILVKALVESNLPGGVVGMVHGFDAGAALIRDPEIRAGAFTGSQRGGRALLDLANARPDPIPFYGELGSVNPVVVMGSAAHRPTLAREYVDSLLLGAGQFCTNPSLLFVPASAATLVEQIKAELTARERALLLHPGVVEQLERSIDLVASASGVEVLAGALHPAAVAGDRSLGREPLLFEVAAEHLLEDRTALEVECFGPVGVLSRYASQDELLSVLGSLEGALVGCVHAEVDDRGARQVVATLAQRVGRVVWNGWSTGVSVTRAQHHGGPWPATTNPLHSSVGTTAVRRFLRPVAFQGMPATMVPNATGSTSVPGPLD